VRLTRAVSVVLGLVAAAVPSPARAVPSVRDLVRVEDPRTPRLPTPLSLPELTHDATHVTIASAVGRARVEDSSRPSSSVGLHRAAVEVLVGPRRRYYFGAVLPFGGALPPDGSGGAKFLVGNVEAHARVVFPLPTLLAFGAQLGVVAPTARWDRNGAAGSAGRTAASLEPTDTWHFAPGVVALRPAFDMRLLRAPFVFQVRQGLDVVVDSSGAERVQTAGRLLAYAGVLVSRRVAFSLEASQLYLFSANQPDASRAALMVAPGVRLALGSVDVGAALVSSLFSPLVPSVEQLLALRLSLVFRLGR
jgi:hypothetical protein